MKKKALKNQKIAGAGHPNNKQIVDRRGRVFGLLYGQYLTGKSLGNMEDCILAEIDVKRDMNIKNSTTARKLLDDTYNVASMIRQGSHGQLFLSAGSYYRQKLTIDRDKKDRIANKVAGLIDGGMSIVCSAGTTVASCVRRIAELKKHVTIVTTNLGVMEQKLHGLPVMGTGGVYDPAYHAFTGQRALEVISKMRCRVALMGISGISNTGGLFIHHHDETDIRAGIIKSTTEQVIIVADATKLTNSDTWEFASIGDLIKQYPVTLVTNKPEGLQSIEKQETASALIRDLNKIERESKGRFKIVFAA